MKKNKAVIVFLIRFFVSYFVLSIGYQWYLKNFQEKENGYRCSPITNIVANHAVDLGNTLGLDFESEQHPEEFSIKLFTNKHYTARVVEGCNSISIIVLFWAFIIAFTGKWYKTIVFGGAGSVLIYLLNIARIVLLTVALDKYPEYSNFLHQIIFPSIIYGFTFALWMLWVKFFAATSKKNRKVV